MCLKHFYIVYKKNKKYNNMRYTNSNRTFHGKLTLRGYQPTVLGHICKIDIKRLPNSLNTTAMG